jgi:hypothetical protein
MGFQKTPNIQNKFNRKFKKNQLPRGKPTGYDLWLALGE